MSVEWSVARDPGGAVRVGVVGGAGDGRQEHERDRHGDRDVGGRAVARGGPGRTADERAPRPARP